MISRRLRVLVIAYECSPMRQHAPGSAWQVIRRLAEWHELWVVTEATQYQKETQAYLAEHPAISKHLHFIFVPRDTPRRPYRTRPVLPIGDVQAYKRWQRRVFSTGESLHRDINFDVVHLLRRDSFREPGFCWRLPVPFVWGPTGGTNGVPWCLMSVLGVRGFLLHAVRNVITQAQLRFNPRVRAAARRASFLIAQTAYDQRRFREVFSINAVLAHEQATHPLDAVNHRSYDGRRALAVAWVGRCVALKGMPILLKALKNPFLRGRVSLHIAGDGPYRDRWSAWAARLGIADQCEWHGWLSQDKTIEMLKKCDVLAFTSLLEATSTTVMQALSVGLPVISLNHCGFGDVLDDTCGIVIRIASFRRVVRDFSSAIAYLVNNPEAIERLSCGAHEMALRHTWDHLAHTISQVYEKSVLFNKDRLREPHRQPRKATR